MRSTTSTKLNSPYPRCCVGILKPYCGLSPTAHHNSAFFLPAKWNTSHIPVNRKFSFQEMTIGIMPLDDTDASRGKCSYKMIQYMSCGIPVVVSPIGINTEVLQKGDVGFGVGTPAEWANALKTLLRNPDLCQRLGQRGRQIAESDSTSRSSLPNWPRYFVRKRREYRF